MVRSLKRDRGQRVVDSCEPPRLESGPGVHTWRGPSRVAVLVQWSDTPRVSRSASEYAAQLVANGYSVAVCSSSEVPDRLEWPHGLPDGVSVYRRPNVGYDFGSWASMLHAFPQLRESDHVLLINDSLIGPFSPIQPILARFESSRCDVWGLVSNTQYDLHLQSFCVGYKGGALMRRPIARFWGDIRLQPTKLDLILKYEIGLTAALTAAKARIGVGFPYHLVVNPGENPTIAGWRRLLFWNFPWVKRELVLRRPVEAPDALDVRAVVLQRFGHDVQEWI